MQELEGAQNCQMIHIAGGEEPVPLRRPMQEMETELLSKGFIRVHKGYLVNCDYIRLIPFSQHFVKGEAPLFELCLSQV